MTDLRRSRIAINVLENKILKDPTTPTHKINAELKVNPQIIRIVVHDDLSVKSFTRMPKKFHDEVYNGQEAGKMQKESCAQY